MSVILSGFHGGIKSFVPNDNGHKTDSKRVEAYRTGTLSNISWKRKDSTHIPRQD